MFDHNLYLLIKALHIVAFTAWMAGLFYLPRLFVYHTRLSAVDSPESYGMFVTMEHKLLKIIMRPAMIATWILGLLLAYNNGYLSLIMPVWLILKLIALIALTYFHHLLVQHQRRFEARANTHPERFFRIINEAPTLALVAAVFLAIFKPFA